VSSGWKVERRRTGESGCGAWVKMEENERWKQAEDRVYRERGIKCYDSKLKVLSNETTLVLSNTRELNRVHSTK